MTRPITRPTHRSHAVRPGRSVATVMALAFALIVVRVAPGQSSVLADRIQQLVEARADLGNASIGIHVRDARSDTPLYGRGATTPMIPASNLKLLTTGAAALVLGPDMVFTTDLAIEGDRLVVIGSGDPGFADPTLLRESDPPLSVDDLLDRLAGAVADRAPTVNEIIIDDRV
ncbi:MAG: hypothetical protein CMJ31_06495, partial [Phycisphaerae bacterium]|nr:hypothetical protein [Phycisphaerae bacterium]